MSFAETHAVPVVAVRGSSADGGGQMSLRGCEDTLPLPLSSEGSFTGATRRPHIQLGCRLRLDFLSAAAPHSTCMKSKHLGLM